MSDSSFSGSRVCAGNLCSAKLVKLKYDRHSLCTACRGQECSQENTCSECMEWSQEFWQTYSSYQIKLVRDRDRKAFKRKEARLSSSSVVALASPPLPAVPSSSPTPSSTAALSPSHIPPSSSPASQYVFPKAKPSLEADKSEFVLFRNQMEAQMNGFMESVLSLVRSHRSPGVSVGDDVSVGVGDNNVVVRDRVSGESARFSESFEQRQLSRSPSEARRQSGAGEKVRNSCPRAGSSSKAQESLSPGGRSSKLDSPSKRRKASGRRESDPSTRRSSRHR